MQNRLSKDVLTYMMTYLDKLKDLQTTGQVCTEWRQANESHILWQPMFYKLLAHLQVASPEEAKILTMQKQASKQKPKHQDTYHAYCIHLFKLVAMEKQAEEKRQIALAKKKRVIDYVEKREAGVWKKIIHPILLVSATLFPIGILLKCVIPGVAMIQPLWFAVFVMWYLFLLGLLGGLLFSQVGSACASCVINSRGYKEDWYVGNMFDNKHRFFFAICHVVLVGFTISSILLNLQLAFQYDVTQAYWNW